MLTTFDKYLLKRFLHTFCVLFVATFGLFVVFDLFTNVDAFQAESQDAVDGAMRIATYYAYRAAEFFELIGSVLIVIAVIIVLALMYKQSEVHPILAAGIPTYRLAIPFVVGCVMINGLLIANQELLIPSIAYQLQAPRGASESDLQQVEPVYDYSNHLMHIDGESIAPSERKLVAASFTLPAPELVREVVTLNATEAIYYPATARRPGGWLLHGARDDLMSARLTEEGRGAIVPQSASDDVFIVSGVSFDQLYNRSGNYKLLSAGELVHRIQNPSTGMVPIRNQGLHLHFRFTRPLVSLATVLLAVPLVLRRESLSLVTNLAVCTLVLGAFYGVAQACLYLGSASLIETDLAAWLPLFITAAAAAWLSPHVET